MAGRLDAPLVLVEWDDSRTPDLGWAYVRDVDSAIAKCVSVGWLLRDGAEKVLAPNIGDLEERSAENVQVCGVIVIPASAVTRMVRLQEAGTTALNSSGERGNGRE